MRAQLDLLTNFCQGNKSIFEWYNTVQVQVNLSKIPSRNSENYCIEIFFGSSYMTEDFVSRTIMEGSVYLDKFPASRVRQLVKKFESSKTTMHTILSKSLGTHRQLKSI